MEAFVEGHPRSFAGILARLSGKVPDRSSSFAAELEPVPARSTWHREVSFRRLRRGGFQKVFLYVTVGYLSFLGFLQVLSNVGETIASMYPDEVGWAVDRYLSIVSSREIISSWPGDGQEMDGVQPVACLSHNDEWQQVPLYASIKAGCMGVEADVWSSNGDIYVGHDKGELSPERTLSKLYFEPLLELVSKANPSSLRNGTRPQGDGDVRGVFSSDPSKSVILLVDFKTDGAELFNALERELGALREAGFLTHYNGTSIVQRPITVVASGSASFDTIVANQTYRDIFFDAPLELLADGSETWPNPNRLGDGDRPPRDVFMKEDSYVPGSRSLATPGSLSRRTLDESQIHSPPLVEDYGPSNSYFASTSFHRSVGRVWGSRLTQEQLQRIRSQIRGAHQRGLRARYWGVPLWPIGLRNHVWHVLVREGVDILGIDDLAGATRRDWRRKKGWFY